MEDISIILLSVVKFDLLLVLVLVQEVAGCVALGQEISLLFVSSHLRNHS